MTFGTWSGNQSNRLRWFPCAAAVLVVLCAAGGLLAFQRAGMQRFQEAGDWRDSAGAQEKTEWAFARLRYGGGFGGFRRGSRWRTDWPKADRQFVQGVSRLASTFVPSKKSWTPEPKSCLTGPGCTPWKSGVGISLPRKRGICAISSPRAAF